MDITNKNINPDRDQLRQEREARLENKFIATLRPKKGHRLYKYCLSTHRLHELTDEDFYDPELQINEKFKPYQLVDKEGNKVSSIREHNGKRLKRETKVQTTHRRKIKYELNTLYFSALNEKNAIKEVGKFLNQKLI